MQKRGDVIEHFYDYYRAKRRKSPDEPWIYGLLRQKITRDGFEYYLLNHDVKEIVDEQTLCAFLGEADRDGTPAYECDVLVWEYPASDTQPKPFEISWVGTLQNLLKYKDRIKTARVIGNTIDNPSLRYE